MAVITEKSDQLTNLDASPPVIENSHNLHGRLRIAYFSHTFGDGDAGSSVELVRLPPGKIRLLSHLSYLEAASVAASQTVDVGWDAYTDLDGTAVAADTDGILNGGDIDTTANINLANVATLTAGMKVFESQDGISIRATMVGAVVAAETIEGAIVYVQD